MTADDEENLKLSNKCWVCDKLYVELYVERKNKVRDHDHVTGKYSGSAHNDCNINLSLIKKKISYNIL